MNEQLIYQFFSDDDFLRFSKKINEAEKSTSGEIRISFREKRTFFNRKKAIRKLAEEEFYKLNMHRTRDKTGILLFLLLSEKQFYILADEGINSKVEQSVWDSVRDEIQIEFKNGNFSKGMIIGIEKVGKILSEHFPIKQDDTNELSNKVIF
ncbi:MAG: TPM domain-containing protein [Ignavibacteria bacterium]|nr:TPM domain-containing protein [Ignavibacteria bacterium]